MTPITVGIASRNRPESLARCLRSLQRVADRVSEVVVVDDASDPPLESVLRAALGSEAPRGLRFIRHETPRGPTGGRNRIAGEARTPLVLSLDDDVVVLSAEAIGSAVQVMDRDAQVAVVAFAQTDEAGRPWPGAQSAPVDYPCYVPAFIGFAHLIRRDAFLQVGGYLEQLRQNGEEKELTLRLMDAGHRVVYLPDARIAHLADPGGRDARRYLHQVVRNDALFALYNEPLPMALASVPVRLARYFPMRKGWQVHDPGGFGRVVQRLAADLPAVLRQRRAVRWATLREWRRIGREWPRSDGPPA